jgi:hypothetical protein
MSKPVGRPVSRPCGTVPAYKRHLRHGEAPCTECKAAWADWQRDYYAKRKGIKS